MSESQYKILVVDDDAAICELLSRWLKKEGYGCETAGNGKEALAKFEKNDFSLLLTDINMPEMTGIELQRIVGRRFKDVAVIMVTAVEEQEIARSAFEEGIYSYITKPFARTEVLINVANALRLRELEILNRQHVEELDLLVQERTAELEEALEELKNSHEQILQQEKMACIGQLAAGVAHEINNPVGFISSNLGSLIKYVDKIKEFVARQSEALREEKREEIEVLAKKLKIKYVLGDAGDLINESLEGTERIKKIVMGLKNFSRKDQDEQALTNINDCLESTINVIWNELKYKATLEKDYGDLELMKCYPQQLSQVFMNILVNGAQAIENQGVIGIKTRQEGDKIVVSISDTGCGMPDAIKEKIFQPFFTTKEVGKGTGLGMSIAADIISKHKGKISVQSEAGKGTTFSIYLPVVK